MIYSIIQPKRIHYQSSYVEKAYTKWRLFFRKLIQAVGRFEAKQIINYKLKFFFNFVFFFDNSSEIFFKKYRPVSQVPYFYNGKCRISKA